MRRVALLAVLLAVGCTKRNPAVCCTTAEDCAAKGLPEGTNCADGLRCVQNECEAPQSCQAASDCEPPTPMCAPDGVCGECVDSSTCGDGVCDDVMHACRDCTSDDECATGFCSPATNRCAPGTITPRYLPTICETPATAPMEIAADTEWSTADQCDMIVTQAQGPAICVIRYTAFRVAPAARLRAYGSNALAIVANSELVIDGFVDVSGNGSFAGPGVLVADAAGQPSSTSSAAGGGGGGFRTHGGHGGTQTTGGAQNGGSARDGTGNYLLAGANGGGISVVSGGGGGGAITLIACRGRVDIAGIIDAGGGGGRAGYFKETEPFPFGGAGGGAGGNVVLQGRHVTVTGKLFANGGAGGSGRPDTSDTAEGAPGDDATPSTDCALGGAATRSATGGDGGCGLAPAKDGSRWRVDTSTVVQPSGGGGGGSVGYLQVFTPAGVEPTLTPAAISPGLEVPGTIETH